MTHRNHLRGLLSLLLACLWVTTAVFGDHASAEFPLCQPERAPCCPLSTNIPNGSCPACNLTVPVATKDDGEQKLSKSVSQLRVARSYRAAPAIAVSHRELTPGLQYRRTVFDLKDDLRI